MARDLVLRSTDPAINMAVLALAEQTSEENLDDILNDFVRRAGNLDDPDCLNRVTTHFTTQLGVGSAADVQNDLIAVVLKIDDEMLRAVAATLGASTCGRATCARTRICSRSTTAPSRSPMRLE